jgi:hypothetical protein
MKWLLIPILLVGLAAGAAAQAPAAAAAPKPDLGKILGTWAIEVDAAGQVFSLTMLMETVEGKLAGKVSEQSGMFTDAPLTDIEYDGETLKSIANVSSPPDGATRPWAIELKVGPETLEGTIANEELMISAAMTGKRIKK